MTVSVVLRLDVRNLDKVAIDGLRNSGHYVRTPLSECRTVAECHHSEKWEEDQSLIPVSSALVLS